MSRTWITNHKDQNQVSVEIDEKHTSPERLVVLVNGTITIGSFFILKILVKNQLYRTSSLRNLN